MTPEAAIVAIEQVISRSAALNDARDWSGLAALYADDATLARPNGQRVTGRPAIEATYAATPPARRTRHVCTGTLVDVDGDTAHARTSVLLFTWEHDPDHGGLPDATGPAIGEFDDTLVRSGENWLLAERVATLSARVPTRAD